MIEIRKGIDFNKRSKTDHDCDAAVYYNATDKHGRTIDEGKGNSLLMPFLGALYHLFTGGEGYRHSFFMEEGSSSYYTDIVNLDLNATPVTVEFASAPNSSFHSSSWGRPIYFPPIPGTNIHGLYHAQRLSFYVVELHEYTDGYVYGVNGYRRMGAEWILEHGTPLVGSGTVPSSFPENYAAVYLRYVNSSTLAFDSVMDLRSLRLEAGFGDEPNIFYQATLNQPSHEQLTTTNTVRNLPVIGDNMSTLTYTRDFTNETGATAGIKEVGMFGGVNANAGGAPGLMVTRDVVTIDIPNGQTASLNYRLRIENNADGGLLWQFMELLTRRLNNTSRESRNIFNENITEQNRTGLFRMTGPGVPAGDDGGAEAWLLGPQIGKSADPVINTNVALWEPYDPLDDEWEFYGTTASEFIEDKPNSAFYFDISRVFRNASSQAQDVNEVGLYCAGRSTYPGHIHCIARHKLAAPTSVPAGELLRVTYRFKIVV